MPDTAIRLATEYLHRLAAPGSATTDRELLARFTRSRDEEAFGLLLRRHGPMVLGVCRRSLGPTQDADDAFQAAFVALARQAGRVSGSVPGWLFRVAIRACRRTSRQRGMVVRGEETIDPSDSLAAVEWGEVRRLLDEELSRLPTRLRTPLVLCYLDGRTRDEAAQQLGWSVRTLHRRLDEGRKRLRSRLTRRGLAPALLAAAVLPEAASPSELPSALAQEAIRRAAGGAAIPPGVRRLVPGVHPIGASVMKTALSAVAVVGMAALLSGTRQPTAAGPRPVPTPAPILVQAPAAKDRADDDALGKKIREAQKSAIEYLKSQQKEAGKDIGNWENDSRTANAVQAGGPSALALLALLDSGLKPDDPVVVRGLGFLRTVEPKHTYVVGLQTQVLCKANQKEDAELIKRNVKWLENAVAWKEGKLLGWSYGPDAGGRADNSNSRYAVAGLFAAHKAGFKVTREQFWESVRQLYVASQRADGGWGYVSGVSTSTHTMTASGVFCLATAADVLGKSDRATERAEDAGLAWLADQFQIQSSVSTFYNLDVIAAAGRATGKKQFASKAKKIEWYPLGVEWLLKNQKANGSWLVSQGIDNHPVISTSFALRFLASRPD